MKIVSGAWKLKHVPFPFLMLAQETLVDTSMI